MKIIINNLITDITPEIIADLFCNLDSEQQARFFNYIGDNGSVYSWLPIQLQYITDEHGLTLSGRRVMQYIGEYSHWGIK